MLFHIFTPCYHRYGQTLGISQTHNLDTKNHMSSGEIISILINLAVGIYFAVIYPRSVQKRFSSLNRPRAFTIMLKVVPPVGYLIIAMSLIYAVALLFGWAQGEATV
jgi:hypothetical protein